MRRVHDLRTLRWATLAVITGGLVLLASPALAGQSHVFVGEFGSTSSSPSDPQPLAGPSAVAVNSSTGMVYVADTGNNRVEFFNPEGNYLGEFDGASAPSGSLSSPTGIAVDNDNASPSHGDVYVVDEAHSVVDKFSPSGEYLAQLTQTPAGTFSGVTGVAIDPSGNVWVYLGDGTAAEFDDEGNYVPGSSFATEKPNGRDLAVDSLDHLYVVTGAQFVRRLTPPESGGEQLNSSGVATAVATDASSNNVYVDQGNEIVEYGPFGEPFEARVEGFGSDHLSGAAGLAIDAQSNTVYIADPSTNDVLRYALRERPESPVTMGPKEVGATAATLVGELNPGGHTGELEYQFDYSVNTTCNEVPQLQPDPPSKVAEANHSVVEARVINLEPNTQYAYCLTAIGSGLSEQSEVRSFRTLTEAPTITNQTASAITDTTARIEAGINSHNARTSWSVQYATVASLAGATSAPVPQNEMAGSNTSVAVAQTLSGLQPDTTYYYRLVAENADAEATTGPIMSLRTNLPPAPRVRADVATSIGEADALVGGEIEPSGSATTYTVEYGTTEALGASTAVETVNPTTIVIYVTARLSSLLPSTTYFWRLAARNAGGELGSALSKFTTTSALLSDASPLPPSFSLTAEAEVTPPTTPVRILADLRPIQPVKATPVARSTLNTRFCRRRAKKLRRGKKRAEAMKQCKTATRKK